MQKVNFFRYAEAIINIAIEEKKVSLYKKYATLLLESLGNEEDYLNLLNSVNIDKSDKHKMLKAAFKSNIDQIFYNLMYLLIDRRYIKEINKILRHLIKELNVLLKADEGVVYSTIKLTPTELKAITEKISKLMIKKITLTNELDDGLISGIKVVIGDQVYDNSTLYEIESLKESLLNNKGAN